MLQYTCRRAQCVSKLENHGVGSVSLRLKTIIYIIKNIPLYSNVFLSMLSIFLPPQIILLWMVQSLFITFLVLIFILVCDNKLHHFFRFVWKCLLKEKHYNWPNWTPQVACVCGWDNTPSTSFDTFIWSEFPTTYWYLGGIGPQWIVWHTIVFIFEPKSHW
jgi:hypothetical protein